MEFYKLVDYRKRFMKINAYFFNTDYIYYQIKQNEYY